MKPRKFYGHRWGLLAVIAATCSVLLAGPGSAAAARVGGFGGGAHIGVAGRGFVGRGFVGRGFAGRGFVGRGFVRPGFRRFGWYGRPFYGPWWGWYGLGLGLWLTALPWWYQTYWWDGIPYYYTGSNYYVWNSQAGQYQAVQPPSQVVQQVGAQPQENELFAYPQKGQSDAQQATDKQQCRDWARMQSGFNPADAGSVAAPSGAAPSGSSQAAPGNRPGNSPNGRGAVQSNLTQRSEYLRAEAACLQARGYSVS